MVSDHGCEHHIVHFYGDAGTRLAPTAGRYLFDGLSKCEGVLAVATYAHREEISLYLRESGGNPDRIFWVDAENTLDDLMVGGWPNWERFDKIVRALLSVIPSGANSVGARVYGDMVSVLWERNRFAAAIELEGFWNRLLRLTSCRLFCAYPIATKADFHSDEVKAVLSAHSHLIKEDQEIPLWNEEGMIDFPQPRCERDLSDWTMIADVAADDLQEPIKKIRMLSRLVIEGRLTPEQAIDFGRLIEGSAEHMSLLLAALHRYARIPVYEPFSTVDLARAVRRAVRNLRSLAEWRHATITIDPLPSVHARESNLILSMEELLKNALQSQGAEDIVIHVSAERLGRYWVVKVQDNGLGVPEEQHERIFDLFFRLNERKSLGVGAGLAICKRAIESMNGRIWLESKPSQGSTFCVALLANV